MTTKMVCIGEDIGYAFRQQRRTMATRDKVFVLTDTGTFFATIYSGDTAVAAIAMHGDLPNNSGELLTLAMDRTRGLAFDEDIEPGRLSDKQCRELRIAKTMKHSRTPRL